MKTDKRNRFLQELQEHSEDAGSVKAIGDQEELMELFNAYAQPRRQRIAIILFVAGVSLISTSYLVSSVGWENSTPPQVIAAIPAIFRDALLAIGIVVYQAFLWVVVLPLTVIFTSLNIDDTPVTNTLGNWLFFASPILTSVMWTTLATLMLFPPQFTRIRPKTLWTSQKKS